jgi:hypothetical protein
MKLETPQQIFSASLILLLLLMLTPMPIHAQIGQIVAGCSDTVTCKALHVDASGNIFVVPSASSVEGISPNPAFTATYTGTVGMTAVASASTTSLNTATTLVTEFPIVNISGATVTINAMDGAGNYFLRNFSLPANSALPAGWAYNTVWLSGIKISASVASSVNAQANGFQ